MNVEEIRIPVPWGIISGKSWGVASDVPVLMIHGVQDNAATFDNLIPLLPQQGFYYICIDLPGHGRSSCYPPHMFYSIMSYVENIRVIIVEHLKLERFYYIGHSMGGHIGYIFASAFSNRVIKMVALDTLLVHLVPSRFICLKVRERINDMVRLERRLVDKQAPEHLYDEAIARISNGRINHMPERFARMLAERSLIKTANGFSFSTDQRLKLNVLTEFSFEQYKNFIENIQCPLISIFANESVNAYKTAFQRNHEGLFKGKKNYKQVIVSGTHDVHLVDSKLVAPIISQFLLSETRSRL